MEFETLDEAVSESENKYLSIIATPTLTTSQQII